MKIQIQVPEQLIRDTVGGANIRYWTARGQSTWDRDDCRLTLTEDDGGKVFSLHWKQWGEAVKRMAEHHPRAFGIFLAGEGDSDTGDLLVQLAAFGELKYG